MAGQQAAQMQNQLNDAGAKVDWRVARKQPEGNHVSGKIEPSGAAASTDEIRVKNLGPLVDAIAESEKQVVAALQKDKKLTLVENRGVAKRERFGSKDEGFLRWKLRTALRIRLDYF